jgi:uncharacterized protein YbjT (DUF2867 family)
VRILVTGISGFVGGALAPRLLEAGHEVRGVSRRPEAVDAPEVDVRRADVSTGAGLLTALRGCDAAYYLVHAMEPGEGSLLQREARAADRFARAAQRAGVERVVYLGGLVPPRGTRPHAHLAARLATERTLLERLERAVALRASIVIGARSRSFRFLVRLVERLPVLALPAWRERRTQPIDQRDVLAALVGALHLPADAPRSLDVAGPDVLTYGEMITRIAELMLVERPAVGLPLSATPLAARVAAEIAGERHELVGPLMEGLEHDLLPRELGGAERALALLGVRPHAFDAAVERALREWEAEEALAAR